MAQEHRETRCEVREARREILESLAQLRNSSSPSLCNCHSAQTKEVRNSRSAAVLSEPKQAILSPEPVCQDLHLGTISQEGREPMTAIRSHYRQVGLSFCTGDLMPPIQAVQEQVASCNHIGLELSAEPAPVVNLNHNLGPLHKSSTMQQDCTGCTAMPKTRKRLPFRRSTFQRSSLQNPSQKQLMLRFRPAAPVYRSGFWKQGPAVHSPLNIGGMCCQDVATHSINTAVSMLHTKTGVSVSNLACNQPSLTVFDQQLRFQNPVGGIP